MNLHEHQAKALLRDYGLPVPKGGLAATPEEASGVARGLGGGAWAVKAQVHAGARGKAGGVQVVKDIEAVASTARDLLGQKLVTGQTGRDGLLVKHVYVEQAQEIAREIYAAVLVDRAQGHVVVVASGQGGEDVEQALARPEERVSLAIGPERELGDEAAADLADGLDLAEPQAADLARILAGSVRAFYELDASLIELNPLGLTDAGEIVALDVKMVLDDNALFRHPELEELRDEDEVDPQEREAHRFELNYVRMDGDIGVMATGAGLALATVDMIKARGGAPADFMDVRPVASRDQVAEGMRLLLGDQRVQVVLVHAMGGGILRCDTIAEGIAKALRQPGTRAVPVVFCAAGTAKEIAELTLRNQAIAVIFADGLGEAVDEAVRLAKAGRA